MRDEEDSRFNNGSKATYWDRSHPEANNDRHHRSARSSRRYKTKELRRNVLAAPGYRTCPPMSSQPLPSAHLPTLMIEVSAKINTLSDI
jgi:hypothetical protein